MRVIAHAFRHFADFSGCASRQDFWQFVVITQLVLIALLLPAWFLFLSLFNEIINDPRVLDLLFAMAQDPAAAYGIASGELVDTLADIWQPFAAELPAKHLPVLICTMVAAGWGALIIIPTLSLTARRLRDAGHSRWWVLPPVLLCIPLPLIADIGFVGSILTLIFCSQGSRKSGTLPPIPHTAGKSGAESR